MRISTIGEGETWEGTGRIEMPSPDAEGATGVLVQAVARAAITSARMRLRTLFPSCEVYAVPALDS
jgi:hypothetical protein